MNYLSLIATRLKMTYQRASQAIRYGYYIIMSLEVVGT